MVCGTPLHAQGIAVIVNGDPITNYDIEQRTKLDFLSTHKMPPRQQVIDDTDQRKGARSRKARNSAIDPGSSDIDCSVFEHEFAGCA